MSAPQKILTKLLLLESLLVAALGLYMISLGFTHDKEWAPYLGVIVFAFAGAAGLFALSRGIKDGKHWAISPSILANLIALGVAYYQIQGHFYIGALIILACAVPALIGLFGIARSEGNK
jgi:peptidoglycan/LPS O-acetylase OafA/YrhL